MKVLLTICLLLISTSPIASAQPGAEGRRQEAGSRKQTAVSRRQTAASRIQAPARKATLTRLQTLTRSQIKEAERGLADMGYWTGPVDGVLDAGTRAALIAFQKWQGRPVTGRLTIDELEAIRTTAGSKEAWPKPRERGYAHVEVDLDRQVLLIVGDVTDNSAAGSHQPLNGESPDSTTKGTHVDPTLPRYDTDSRTDSDPTLPRYGTDSSTNIDPMLPRYGTDSRTDTDPTLPRYGTDSPSVRVLPVSTGNDKEFIEMGQTSVAYTPRGRFVVYDKTFGWENGALGSVYYANYISGGVAIHGSLNVPAQPASHGCIRIPMFAAKEVSKLLKVGTIVLVYDKVSFVSAKDWVKNPELKQAALLESVATSADYADYTEPIKNKSKSLVFKKRRSKIIRT